MLGWLVGPLPLETEEGRPPGPLDPSLVHVMVRYQQKISKKTALCLFQNALISIDIPRGLYYREYEKFVDDQQDNESKFIAKKTSSIASI
jgi:hypothetical protein